MKRSHWLCAAALPGLLTCGCQHMSYTDKGVLGGGAVGATIGALASRNKAAGAVLGGIGGAVVGGLVGNAKDDEKRDQAIAAAHAAAIAGPHHLQEIAQMAQNHISDPVIISKVRSSGLVYQLSGSDINYLKSYGVGDAVIVEMNQTARAPRRVYQPVQPVYVVQPPPPPAVIGVGVRVR